MKMERNFPTTALGFFELEMFVYIATLIKWVSSLKMNLRRNSDNIHIFLESNKSRNFVLTEIYVLIPRSYAMYCWMSSSKKLRRIDKIKTGISLVVLEQLFLFFTPLAVSNAHFHKYSYCRPTRCYTATSWFSTFLLAKYQ